MGEGWTLAVKMNQSMFQIRTFTNLFQIANLVLSRYRDKLKYLSKSKCPSPSESIIKHNYIILK